MRFISLFMLFLFLAIPNSFAKEDNSKNIPQEYKNWLVDLKKEMVDRGISKKTVDSVFAVNYYHEAPQVVKIDRKQIEFVLTPTDYINRVVNQKRVEKAQENYTKLLPLLKKIEKKYGVQPQYIVAFWAVETNFGSHFGGYNLFEVLTQLSYDKRRSKFFKTQLFEALKIVDTYNVDFTKVESSWAGAMGHFQFMPSTFNAYAVDYTGDNQIDIWHSFEDAAASAANYLAKIGWDKNNSSMIEVSLPWNFDFSISGRNKTRSVKEWKKIGVRTLKLNPLPFDDELKASIILPEGKKGSAYLVLNNFHKIMQWNRSENYALAISILADYIKTGKKWQLRNSLNSIRLKTDDVLSIQTFINKLGLAKVDEDGELGSQTREAIMKVQKQAKLPADGYPDYQLLSKIKNYNPEIGFSIPVPERKTNK